MIAQLGEVYDRNLKAVGRSAQPDLERSAGSTDMGNVSSVMAYTVVDLATTPGAFETVRAEFDAGATTPEG